ncbi:MAG: aryl-sulfate sulfotransferase [Acidobacteriaceae bacterium]
MARNCARYGACALLATAAVLTGCASGSSSMVNAVSPTTTASISATSYDFGQNIIGNPETQTVVEVTNTGTNPLTLNPSIVGSTPGFTVIAAQSCGTTLAAASSCPVIITFAPTAAGSQTATLNLGLANVPLPLAPGLVSLTGTSAAMTAGTVTATSNPQVALYTITPPFAGNVTVNFGTTTSYGKQTWSVATPAGGGPVSIEVAGLLANTAYHLQAAVTLADGVTATDVDHTFTTSAYPAGLTPHFTATTTSGQTPQSGIEIVNPVGASAQVLATDLSGHVSWAYITPEAPTRAGIFAPKQLANGDFLFLYSDDSSAPINGGLNPADPNLVREVDLIGNTMKQITMAQLNAKLAAANYNVTLQVFSHDVTPLPNGHWLVLANTVKQFTNLPGYPGTTNVLGDVVVDLDTNLNPVWVWNEFDHLDVNRHPALFTQSFPDWTHSNAIVYSKDDGNFLVSIRHQSWVVKVDYNNGAGTGNILWRLGYQGDFTLMNNGAADTNPADWFYGQHDPSFTTTNTTGIFGLTLMDNGNFRIFAPGVTCGTGSAPPCLYSTIPILQINESAMTATLTFHQILPTPLYNDFGGNAETLANGNVEYDLCGLVPESSQVFEVTDQPNPQTVWNLTLASNWAYRAYRLPSLYPGVQW